METTIRTPVYPTEDVSKLKKGVKNIFPDADFSSDDGNLVAHSRDASKLIEMIKDKKVVTTAKNLIQNNGCLVLNKQALVRGKLNIVSIEQPLGNVEVTFEGDVVSLLSAEEASSP